MKIINSTKILLALILSIYILLAVVSRYLLLDKTVFLNTFSEQLEVNEISQIIKTQANLFVIGLFFIPIIQSLKFFFIAGLLMVGIILREIRVSFSDLFKIVLISEPIFFIPQLCKICWFSFFKTDFQLSELINFYPFSLGNIVLSHSDNSSLISAINSFNLFEIAYWFILAQNCNKLIFNDYSKSLMFVLKFYVIGFLVWQIFTLFLII